MQLNTAIQTTRFNYIYQIRSKNRTEGSLQFSPKPGVYEPEPVKVEPTPVKVEPQKREPAPSATDNLITIRIKKPKGDHVGVSGRSILGRTRVRVTTIKSEGAVAKHNASATDDKKIIAGDVGEFINSRFFFIYIYICIYIYIYISLFSKGWYSQPV